MTYTTLKTTVAAIALTAGTAFAGSDMESDAKLDTKPEGAAAASITADSAIPGIDEAKVNEDTSDTAVASNSMERDDDVDEDVANMSFDTMTVAELVGMEVESADGEDVGEIDYIIQSGGEVKAIVGVGGFLGLGEHDVAVPLSDLSFSEEDELTLASWNKAELEAQPDVDESEITALDDDARIGEFL